jgi:hypothetical protein
VVAAVSEGSSVIQSAAVVIIFSLGMEVVAEMDAAVVRDVAEKLVVAAEMRGVAGELVVVAAVIRGVAVEQVFAVVVGEVAV